jgi:hypothetical protein
MAATKSSGEMEVDWNVRRMRCDRRRCLIRFRTADPRANIAKMQVGAVADTITMSLQA